MSTRHVLIITPTYNECDNLEGFVQQVVEQLPQASILVVDDASPDGTGELADRLASADARIHVIHREGKLGLGSAYLEGFRWAMRNDFDIVFEMDTDMSHDPAHLPAFLSAMDQGADVVIGSRNIPGGGTEGWGLGRHVLSKGGSLYSRTILGLRVRDLTSGYKAFRREVLQTLDLDAVRSEGYAFQIELTYRAILRGFRVTEVPIRFVDRRVGHSKMSRKIFLEAITMVWRLRYDALRGRM